MKFQAYFKHRKYEFRYNHYINAPNRDQALKDALKIAHTTNGILTGLYSREEPSITTKAKKAMLTSLLIRKTFKPFYL